MHFPGTRWTEIRAAQDGDTAALESFTRKYRPPVVAYLSRRGFGSEAEDLAQEVFLRFFSGDLLSRAEPSKGRFRNLILAVTRHVIGHHLEKRNAKKRGGGAVRSLGDIDVLDKPAHRTHLQRFEELFKLALVCLYHHLDASVAHVLDPSNDPKLTSRLLGAHPKTYPMDSTRVEDVNPLLYPCAGRCHQLDRTAQSNMWKIKRAAPSK